MLDIFSFFTAHLATSQLATIKSPLTDVFMIQKTKERNRLAWKLAQSVLPSTYHTPKINITNFLDNILKFR